MRVITNSTMTLILLPHGDDQHLHDIGHQHEGDGDHQG